ncbi:unnamed protein product [Prunus armeniaca]
MSSPKVIDKQLNEVLEFGDGQVRLRMMCGSLYQLLFEVNIEFGELGFHASDIVRNFCLGTHEIVLQGWPWFGEPW